MSSLRIMHVDDDDDIREVVSMSLALDPRIELKSCNSGTLALQEAAAWQPDLILMDVMMPLMDGPETLIRLRKQEPTAAIPVIFMTAKAQRHELEHFRSLGAAAVFAKPFDPLSLAESLRGCLAQLARPA